MIKNIIFDVGQVLVVFDPDCFVNRYDLQREEKEQLILEVFRGEEWLMLDKGCLTVSEAIPAIEKRLPEKLQRYVKELVDGWWNDNLEPIKGMRSLIDRLKAKGYGLYILSNAPVTMRKYLHRVPGADQMDGVYITGEHRLVKPTKEVFEDFLKTFALQAEQCFFIDDSPANVKGAEKAKIQGTVFTGDMVQLKRKMQHAGIII